MSFLILICLFPTFIPKIISDTINPTSLSFIQESTLVDQNSNIYFTIESKFTPASYAYQNLTSTNQFKQQIFVVQNDSILSSRTSYVFLYFLEIDPFLKTLNHNFEIETQKQKYFDSFQAQNTNYEGFWYTLEIRNDFTLQILNLTFYQNSNKNSILYQKIFVGETLLITNTFSFYIGDSKISKSLGYSQLQGPIKYQLITYQTQFSPQKQTPYRSNELALRENINFSVNTYYEYIIPETTSKSYAITTWVKISQNEKQYNFVNLVQIQSNPNFQYLNQIGGKLLQISYQILSTQQFVEIIFQNYSFPFLPTTIHDNEDPLEQRTTLELPSTIDLYQWHYLTISYQNNKLVLFLNYISQNQSVQKSLERVNQFSDLTLFLHFGGTAFNFSSTDGTFVFPYFYYIPTSAEPICHSTCESCFGPYYNQCVTCLSDSNRFLNYNKACICNPGYLEINYPFCYQIFDPPIQETYIPLSKKQGYDQEYPEVVCSYGYFKYDDECYACPKLNKLYFCPECIQYPNTWVFNPKCNINYQQFNQSINNTFTQDIIFNSTNLTLILNSVNIYIFNNLELTFCSHCLSLCLTSASEKSCKKSDYYFLQRNIMVTCDFGAVLQYGQCKICPVECDLECILINKEFICKNKIENKLSPISQLNDVNQCMNSIFEQNIFLKYGFSACIICSIPNCKVCFQYIQDNLYYNTIFNNNNAFYYGDDDLATGCALCENGYIFNFYTGQCQIRLQILGNSCTDYYISQTNTAICTSSNSFSVGIQLNDCHQYLTNCKKCIQPGTNQYYCLECDFGYFVSKLQGLCQSCLDTNPLYLDCAQTESEKSMVDLYKLTPQFFSLTNQFPGIQPTTYLKVGVKECIQGYLKSSTKYCYETDSLYCLANDYGCRHCESTPDGTKRLTILNLKCSNCPYYCEYCKPRLISELQQLNPFLNLTQITQTYLTYRCIQKSSLHENIFLDNKQQLSRLCTPEIPKCQLQIANDLNYFEDLSIILFNSFPLDNLYYHLRSVNILELSLVINKNYSETSSFQKTLTYENNLISQIPSLHTIRLIIQFKKQNTGLIFGQVKFQDCQEIYFIQACIIFNINPYSFLIFESKGRIKFQLENVIIKDALLFNVSNISKQYQIVIQNPYYINFTNVLVQNISIVNSTFFDFTQVDMKFYHLEILYFYNVTFFNCSFFETSIISLLEGNQYQIIQFYKLKFIQCQFISSYFLFSENLNVLGSFLIEEFLISESRMDDSVLILLPLYQNITIKYLTLEKTKFKNTDFLSSSNSLIMCNIKIKENILVNFNFLKHRKNSFYLESYTYVLRHFDIKNNIYSQLKFVDLQKQSQEYIKVTIFDLTHMNLTSQNVIKDKAYYFYNIQADEVLIEKIQFFRQPGQKDFHIFDCFLIQITNSIVQANITQNQSTNLENYSLNTLFTIASQQTIVKNFQFYNQLGVDVIFIEVFENENLNSLNSIQIYQLDIQNVTLIKTTFSQISTFFQSQCQKSQQVVISDSFFSKVILNEYVQDTRVSSAALAVIISDSGVINLSNIVLDQIFVLNSTNPVLLIQSEQLIIFNISATNINSFFENSNQLFFQTQDFSTLKQSIQINCLGGLFNIQIQSVKVESSVFNDLVALQGGAFYITTKKNGLVKFFNNTFKNITTNSLNPQEGKGGCLFINSENSYLHFIFQDNIIINSTSGFQAGAFYIKLSYYSSQIYISNLFLSNVFSFKNSVFYSQLNELNFDTIQKIVIEKLYLNNGFDEFLQYFEKFNQKVSDLPISEQNAMFYFSNFQTKISNFRFSGFTIEPIIYVKFTKYLIVYKLELQNITHISNAIIFIENNQITPSSMLINQICICNSTLKQILVIGEDNNQHVLHQLLQHRNNIDNSVGKALIQFKFYKNLQFSHVNQLYLINNKCEICDEGLVNLQNSQQEKKIRINKLIMLKNLCGIDSCFSTQNLLVNEQYNTISQSKIIDSIANYSGALKSQDFNLNVRNTSFIKNLATYKGGAIFHNNTKKNLKYERVYFIQNEAEVGGAIFDLNLYNKSEEKLYYFIQNKATLYGNNLATQPTELNLFLNDCPASSIEYETEQGIISEIFYLTDNKPQQFLYFPSGTSFDKYLIFDWKKLQFEKFDFKIILKPKNLLKEDMILTNESFCTSNSSIISNNIKNLNTEQQLQFIGYDFEDHSFNLKDTVYTLNPEKNNVSYIQVEISCVAIQNFYLRFQIKSFRCQIGEYFENSQCIKCAGDQGFFSVRKNSTLCKKINTQMIKSTTGAMIELQPGYWRPNLRSDLVEECQKFSARCVGGWSVGDAMCGLGAIGALCEQCDIYNIRGDGNFINTNNETCSRCGEMLVQVILVLLQSLWIIFTVGLTVNSNHSSNKQLFVLKSLYRHYQVVYKQMMDQTSTLIKLANNHIQILSLIDTFQLQMIWNFKNFILFLGDSNYMISYQIDCSLPEITSIEYEYSHYILIIFYPFFHFTMYIILLSILLVSKKITYNMTFIYSSIIYLYCLNQQNLIKWGVFLIGKRVVSGINWIQANVSSKYDTETHFIWQIRFIYPMLIIIGIIIPLFLFLQLRSIKYYLENRSSCQKYSYLYHEYNFNSYFWEIVKMIQKFSIILIVNYYEQYVMIKGLIILLVMLLYYYGCQKIQPYKLQSISSIDVKTSFILSLIIAFSLLLYTIQKEEMIYLLYQVQLISFILAVCLIEIILHRIIKAYIQKLDLKFDFIRKMIISKFPSIQKFSLLKSLVQLRLEQQQRVSERFKKLRTYLKIQSQYMRDNSLRHSYLLKDSNSIGINFLNSASQLTTKRGTNVQVFD